VRAVGHYVLVKPDTVESVSAGGIITGTQGQLQREQVASVKGTLVSIGDIAWADYTGGRRWANIGDRVFFKRHVADRIQDEKDIVDGKPQEYFLMNDNNILGVIEDE
jgi:co-chaperonin GroES (HSP10)